MKALAVLVWLLLIFFPPKSLQGWPFMLWYVGTAISLWFGSDLLERYTRAGAYISGFIWAIWWHMSLDLPENAAPEPYSFGVARVSMPVACAFAHGFSRAASHPFTILWSKSGPQDDGRMRLVLVPIRANTGAHMK